MNALPMSLRKYLSSGVVERVAPVLEQGLVRVHAGAVLAEQRLGHERRVPAVLERVLLDRDAVGHAVVGHLQRAAVPHVDLVLGRTDLVVRVLDVDAQALEREHRVAADVGAGVEGREVEVAALVQDLGALVVLEQVVLELRADVEDIEAHVLRPLLGATQHVARVTLVGAALRRLDVGEHARHAGPVLRPPGQHVERGRVGHGDHVRLFDGVEAGDRRAVEAHAALEGVVELLGGDREGLELPEDVGEPEADEADAVLRDQRLDVFGVLWTV